MGWIATPLLKSPIIPAKGESFMRLHASLFSALILAACLTPARAQSAPTQPLSRDYLAPHDSRDQLPAVTGVAKAAKLNLQQPVGTELPKRLLPNVAGGSSTCYAIRSYNYAPTNSLAEMPAPRD